jgi:hypothetical protein
VRSGKSNGVVILLFKIHNFPEYACSLLDSPHGKIKEGNLTLSTTKLKLKLKLKVQSKSDDEIILALKSQTKANKWLTIFFYYLGVN